MRQLNLLIPDVFLRLLLALLLLGSAPASRAQGPPLPLARVAVVRDSLQRLLATQPGRDTLRTNRLNALSFLLRTNEDLQSRRLAQEALRLARQLAFQKGLLDAHFNLGYHYRAHNQYDSALYHSRWALALAISTHNGYTQTRAYYNLARIYTEQGNYAAALSSSLDGLALARRIHNPRAELFQLLQAALIELALNEYTAARAHVVEAQRLVPAAHDLLGTGFVYSALGDLSRQQGQWEVARGYYLQAAANYRLVWNSRGMIPIELSIAEMTERLGQEADARRAASQLLRRARTTGTPEQRALAALLLARTWLATGRPDSARRYAAQSLATARPSALRPTARDAALVLAQASDQLGQGHAAYAYQRLASAYTDSITGEAARRRVAALEAQAEHSRQRIEIDLLQQRARLQHQRQELDRLRYRQQVAGLGALVALVLALGAALLWRYRRREAQRLLALRTRIAADLHDEVGSILTQISMQSTVLREGSSAPAQQQAYLDQMAEASRQAARQLNDAVWSIDARHDSMASLLDRLRDHAYEVLPPTGIELLFSADPALLTLTVPLATRQALYFVYKEALHNVVKHARGARQVQVRLRRLGAHLHLEVCDDGTAPLLPRPGGQGLRNMQMRAAAVGGTMQLEAAEPAPGTCLLARLPV